MHPTAPVQYSLSISFACLYLKWVMSHVAAVTVQQLYITRKQKTCIAPADCEGFPQDTRVLLLLAVTSGIPHFPCFSVVSSSRELI